MSVEEWILEMTYWYDFLKFDHYVTKLYEVGEEYLTV